MNGYRTLSIIEGIILIILGFIVISQPYESIFALSIFFAWMLIVLGVIEFINGFSAPDPEYKWMFMISGIVVFFLGLLFLFKNPAFGAEVLVYLVIVWFLIISFIQLITSIKTMSGGWRVFIIIVDIYVMAVCIFSLFSPYLAVELFVYIIAINFFFLGFTKLFSPFGIVDTKDE